MCNIIQDYDDYLKFGQTGCGSNSAYIYMISFQWLFAIIFLNLFVAVILQGFEESSNFEEANLSEFYLESFKLKWNKYDEKATGLMEIKYILKFLSSIELPFKTKQSYLTIMGRMRLPIIQKVILKNNEQNESQK